MEHHVVARLLALFILAIGLGNCLVVDSEGQTTRLDALEYMLVEEKQLRAQLKTELETKISALQTSVNVLDSSMKECGCTNGAPKSHPAFMATFLSAGGVDCTTNQVAILDDVKINSGSGYNPTHGIFTAPVAGIYTFQVSLASPPHTNFHVALVQNVTSNEIGYLFNEDDSTWKTRSTSTVTHLNAGEEVWMICMWDSHLQGHNGGQDVAYDYHSHFSGFLIAAD